MVLVYRFVFGKPKLIFLSQFCVWFSLYSSFESDLYDFLQSFLQRRLYLGYVKHPFPLQVQLRRPGISHSQQGRALCVECADRRSPEVREYHLDDGLLGRRGGQRRTLTMLPAVPDRSGAI